MTGTATTPDLVIHGGNPTDEESAAVVAGLLALTASRRPSDGRPSPAWALAARLEATGAAPFASASDPRLV